MAEIEDVVLAAEQAHSLEACAHALRPEPISLPAALRWVRRRLAAVRTLLSTAVAMLPQLLHGCAPRLAALRERLGVASALTRLRQTLAPHLPALAAPLGFRHRCRGGEAARRPSQQHMGPDPPP
jgi:hypothetical protein